MTPTPAPVLPPHLRPGRARRAPAGLPRRSSRTVIAAGLFWLCAHAVAAPSSPLPAPPEAIQDWPAWRGHLLLRLEDDTGSALSQLRQWHEQARERGDRHAEWMYAAWLARETARWAHGDSAPWLTLAEQALQAAQRAGNATASFELLVATEAARLEQQVDGVREGRLAQAEALAAELGDPLRAGLVARLRGLAALQQGQPGAALVQFQRALPLTTHAADRAALLRCLAQASLEQPGPAGTQQADGYLQDLHALQTAQPLPLAIDTLLLQAEVLRRQSRHAEALTRAQQAVALARQRAVPSPLARAQSLLGQVHLAAGDPLQALAHLQAVSLAALNLPDQLATLAAQAAALAQQGDRRAAAVLAQAQALIEQAPQRQDGATLRFLEQRARILAQLGDAEQAVQALTRAAALRAQLASATRDQLVQARLEAARGAATTRADEQQERLLAAAAGMLLLALAVLASLALWQRRRCRQLVQRSHDLDGANTQLQAVYTARQRHLAAACHDLRPPAQVIVQVADTALSSQDDAAAATADAFQAAQRCSRTLNDMLDAMLDLSVLEQGRYAPRMQPVALGDLLADVDLQYRRSALDKGLTWQVGATAAVVQADRQLLRRVLFHLAANAVRHSSQGGIQIQAVIADTEVSVDVADTGPGLPVEQLAGAAPDTDATPGSALGQGSGLAIVREACRLMSHQVSVPLSSPRGSVVRVTMPRCRTAPASGTAPAPGVAGHTVAVVEPERAQRQALLEALGAAGLQAASFVSLAALREASVAYPIGGPDALVVDLGAAPLMPAVSALQAWLQDCPTWRGPVLALTADLRIEGLMQAAELGVHLACQPLSPGRLIELLQDLLRPVDLQAAPHEVAAT